MLLNGGLAVCFLRLRRPGLENRGQLRENKAGVLALHLSRSSTRPAARS